MRPRARARGITARGNADRGCSSRFNEAASARSRNYSGALVDSIQAMFASMRPRARARGIGGHRRANAIALTVASMRPRARARGITGRSVRTPESISACFNEAASARSRNCRVGAVNSLADSAASMRPRARARGIVTAARSNEFKMTPASMRPRARARGISCDVICYSDA